MPLFLKFDKRYKIFNSSLNSIHPTLLDATFGFSNFLILFDLSFFLGFWIFLCFSSFLDYFIFQILNFNTEMQIKRANGMSIGTNNSTSRKQPFVGI